MRTSESSQERHSASLTEASENDPTGIDAIYVDFVFDELIDLAGRLEHAGFIFCSVETKGIDIEPTNVGDAPIYQRNNLTMMASQYPY